MPIHLLNPLRLQKYYKFFKFARFLAKKIYLCLHKYVFLIKRLLFARQCERTFGGSRFGRTEGTTNFPNLQDF